MSQALLLQAMQKHALAVRTLLATGVAGDAAKLEGLTLAQILASAENTAKLYTDAEVLDMVEGNALIEAVDAAIAELSAPIGGDFYTAITERSVALGAGAAINVSQANHYTKTVTGNTTFSVTNAPAAGRVGAFVLHLTNAGASVVQWWANVRWAEGQAPTLSAAGRDVIAFSTMDGGATWDGYLLGKDMKAAA
jgi:hypothetical protein